MMDVHEAVNIVFLYVLLFKVKEMKFAQSG